MESHIPIFIFDCYWKIFFLLKIKQYSTDQNTPTTTKLYGRIIVTKPTFPRFCVIITLAMMVHWTINPKWT